MDIKILLLTLACIICHGAIAQKIKGMAFGTGHDVVTVRKPVAQESLNLLKTTGVNFIHISAYIRMTDKMDMQFYPAQDEASIRFQLQMVKKNALKAFFKPVVEIDGEVWRGFIPGRDEWLLGPYAKFIVKMAEIAQEEKVDLLAVGSEYVQTLSNTAAWRSIIQQVRKVYSGKLTYVANHDSFKNCKFWDALDVISISAYFILLDAGKGNTFGPSPNMQMTKALWEEKAKEVNEWRLSSGNSNKQVLIAEVGAQSKGGGVVYRKPYLWTTDAPTDDFEQEKMYEGILGAFMPKPWCAGVILWNWELLPFANTVEPGRSGYTPQNKPAMNRMKKYFL